MFTIIFWPKLIFFPSCCQYCSPSGPERRPSNCALYRVLLLDIRLHLRICVSFAYGHFILVINLQLYLAWTPLFRIVIRNFMWNPMKQLHSTELWKISQIKIQSIQNTCSQQKSRWNSEHALSRIPLCSLTDDWASFVSPDEQLYLRSSPTDQWICCHL